ncbi:SNF2 family N-terminal domain-containing protein [Microdochium trichocladiopsis]|uniref:SNF2 family N-terminal domain-containing protein n=1 Tax=Microdochium trichocladiopsis TaxID=1682393 RepID=A0A9P8YK20_9PEZI|nr:SNF2 family N-terminal domain-containing protein [Microdochium trichocladiopsis]KAH7040876.1 SNF2 family N-terminal domain-containing protein [Microdochium trichocladiopsis]
MVMAEVRALPGFSMVVCPATLVPQWRLAVNEAFQNGHELSVYVVESTTALTAHQLHALHVDVIITSYEIIEYSYRTRNEFPTVLQDWVDEGMPENERPRRPLSTFHTRLWQKLNLPIKRLILDEAHVINKDEGKRHQAIKALCYEAVVILTGTPMTNRWWDIAGLRCSDLGKNQENTVGILIEAQLLTLSSIMADDKVIPSTDADESMSDRDMWLDRLDACIERQLDDSSPRLRELMRVYDSLRQKRPSSKIIIFSRCLKFLDIINARLKFKGVTALRYDGSAPSHKRPGSWPNLTCASIVIQTEPWFSELQEKQVSRVFGPGQKGQVIGVKIIAGNSDLDSKLSTQGKDQVISRIMNGVIRKSGTAARGSGVTQLDQQ